MSISETITKMREVVEKEGSQKEIHEMTFFGFFPTWAFDKVKKKMKPCPSHGSKS